MNVRKIQFPMHADANGVLCVFESQQHVPFDIQRVFTVTAKAGDTRGDHAHKKCTQLMICVSGSVNIFCNDGFNFSQYLLNDMSTGLFVPPGIWAKEQYITTDSVLMVLCDRIYESDDYIRDYTEFKSFVAA